MTKVREVVPEAYEAFLQGSFWSGKFAPIELRKAADYFERAIAFDSQFAAAWAGLADVRVMLALFHSDSNSSLALAESAARTALQLDPLSAQAEAALSDVASARWDWKEAEARVRRALEIDPSSASAYRRYWLLLAPQRRIDEARQAIEKARKLDPLSAQIASNLGTQLLFEGEYEDAEKQLKEALLLDRDYTLTHAWLWCLYSIQERDPERGLELAEYLTATGYGDYLPEYRTDLSGLGYEKALLRLALRLDERHRGNLNHLTVIAGLLAESGQIERALDWIRNGVESKSWAIAWLAVAPDYRRLRDHPEFPALVRRLGFANAGSPAAD